MSVDTRRDDYGFLGAKISSSELKETVLAEKEIDRQQLKSIRRRCTFL
jgi:hypothetical protein